MTGESNGTPDSCWKNSGLKPGDHLFCGDTAGLWQRQRRGVAVLRRRDKGCADEVSASKSMNDRLLILFAKAV